MSMMMAAGAAGSAVIGGIAGSLMGKSDKKKQAGAIAAAYKELQAIGYPPDLSREIIFKQFQSAGILTPELEQEIEVGASAVGAITEDSSLRDAQKQALSMMQNRAQVGLSAEDRSALNQVRQQVQTDVQAKNAQILQQMSARGQGGSGAELVAQLQNSQSGADRASSASDELMAQAQQRALQALSQSGSMASNLRGQDFDVANTKAQALDERNRFLAQNSIARQSSNINRLNEAQQQNLANKQRIGDANIGQGNQELLRQSNEKGTQWDRNLGYAQSRSNALLSQASMYGQNAAAKSKMGSDLGSAAGQGIAAYGQYKNANPSTSAELQDNKGYNSDDLRRLKEI